MDSFEAEVTLSVAMVYELFLFGTLSQVVQETTEVRVVRWEARALGAKVTVLVTKEAG